MALASILITSHVLNTVLITSLFYRPASSFIPRNDYQLFLATGTQHDKQTETALKYTAAEWFNSQCEFNAQSININNGKLPTDKDMFNLCYGANGFNYLEDFLVAKESIIKANVRTDGLGPLTKFIYNSDISKEKDPTYHFDAEKFNESNANLARLKREIVLNILAEKHDCARKSLGKALHILQDFYSHSNWIEQGNTEVHKGLGDEKTKFRLAVGDTCSECIDKLFYYDCRDNIIVSDGFMTSGYYGDQKDSFGNSIDKPSGKCSHGGRLDSTRNSHAKGGINKDSDNKLWSPHYYLHNDAAKLSIRATRFFLNEIRQSVLNLKFGRFLSLSLSRTLTIVVNIAFCNLPYSNTNCLEKMKPGILNIIDAALKERSLYRYVLIVFGGNKFNPTFTTENGHEFKMKIASLSSRMSLTEDSGYTAQQMTYIAIMIGIAECSQDSNLFVFTSQMAMDNEFKTAVTESAGAKNVKIMFPYSDKPTAHRKKRSMFSGLDDVEQMIEMETGGFYFPTIVDYFDDTDINETTLDALIDSANEIILLEKVYVFSGLTRFIYFNVDSTAKFFVVVGDIFKLYSPISRAILSDSVDEDIVVIDPTPGTWSIQLPDKQVSYETFVAVIVNTQYDINCEFLYNDTESLHPGFQSMDDNPIIGSKVLIQCKSTSNEIVLSSVALLRASDSTVLRFLPFNAESDTANSFNTTVIIPSEPFYLRIDGIEVATKISISRIKPFAISPSFVHLSVSTADEFYDIKPGETLNVFLKITNFGPTDTFILKAFTFTNTLSVSISQSRVTVQGNSTIDLIIICSANRTASESMSNEVLIAAYSQNYDDIVNFFVNVLPQIADNTAPSCQVVLDTYNVSCLRLDNSNCLSSTWQARVRFSDGESGLAYLHFDAMIRSNYTKEEHQYSIKELNSMWTTSWKQTNSAGTQSHEANFISFCCIVSSNLVIIDKVGYSTICTVGKSRPDYLSTINRAQCKLDVPIILLIGSLLFLRCVI